MKKKLAKKKPQKKVKKAPKKNLVHTEGYCFESHGENGKVNARLTRMIDGVIVDELNFDGKKAIEAVKKAAKYGINAIAKSSTPGHFKTIENTLK